MKNGIMNEKCLKRAVIREASIRKEHVASIFFDLEKTYETTWKHGVMWDLHDFGLKGRIPEFIRNFLSIRIQQGCMSLYLVLK